MEGRSGALAQGMEPSLTEKEEIGTLTAVTDRLSRGRGEEEMKPGGAEGIRELEANHCQCRSSPSQSRGGGGVHGGAGSRVLRGRAQLRGACIRGGEIVPTETNRTVSRGVCPGNGPDLCRTCLRRPCVLPSSLTPFRGVPFSRHPPWCDPTPNWAKVKSEIKRGVAGFGTTLIHETDSSVFLYSTTECDFISI